MANATLDKGKGRVLPEEKEHQEAEVALSSASSSVSDSDSDSDTSDDSDSEEEITQEQLNSFLDKARQNALSADVPEEIHDSFDGGEDIIRLGDEEEER